MRRKKIMKDIKLPPNTIWDYIKDVLLFFVMFSVNITITIAIGFAVVSYITLIRIIFSPHSFPWWFYVYSAAAYLIFFIEKKLSSKVFMISFFAIAILNYIIILYFYPKFFYAWINTFLPVHERFNL